MLPAPGIARPPDEPLVEQPSGLAEFAGAQRGVDQHLLEQRTGTQELAILVLGAEPHYALYTAAVVPTPVEETDFASRRQLGDVTLKIPLSALALCWRAECHHAADAGVQALDNAFDGASLAGGVPALEEDDDLEAVQSNPFLQLDELELQMGEFLDVLVISRRFTRLRPVVPVPILLDRSDFLGIAQLGLLRFGRLAVLDHLHPQELT